MIVQFKKWVKFYTFGLLIMSFVGFIYSIIKYPFEEGVALLALFSLILLALTCIHINSFKIQIDNVKMEANSILSRKKKLKINDIIKVDKKHNACRFIGNECAIRITTDLENQQEAIALILKSMERGNGGNG